MNEEALAVWTHHEAIINGIRLHYVDAGPQDGPLVVLLHGFPEFWYSWRYQIPALVAAGYRVVAPDQRGYNTSEKPIGVQNYSLEKLTSDVVALIHHIGRERATVVGHDWGGGIAWAVPMAHPEVVDRLVVLNAPHPGALLRELRTLEQLKKSWYMFFFQLPWLPELLFRLGGPRLIKQSFRQGAARPEGFSDAALHLYTEAIFQPGALTAMLNYYRALFRQSPRRAVRDIQRFETPTLLIWGEQDAFLGPKLTENLSGWVPNLQVKRIAGASHWVQIDAVNEVNQAILDFLRQDQPEVLS